MAMLHFTCHLYKTGNVYILQSHTTPGCYTNVGCLPLLLWFVKCQWCCLAPWGASHALTQAGFVGTVHRDRYGMAHGNYPDKLHAHTRTH